MPNIICVPHHYSRTKSAAAEELGVKIYDTTLPQTWLDSASMVIADRDPSKTRDQVYGMLLTSVVWGYDQARIFGAPQPLTLTAFTLLKAHDRAIGTHYADEVGYTHNVLLIGD
jgi:hypothetical protein